MKNNFTSKRNSLDLGQNKSIFDIIVRTSRTKISKNFEIDDKKYKDDDKINSYSFKSTIFSSSESKNNERINFNFHKICTKKIIIPEKKVVNVSNLNDKSKKTNFTRNISTKLNINETKPKNNSTVKNYFDKLKLNTLNTLNLRLSQKNFIIHDELKKENSSNIKNIINLNKKKNNMNNKYSIKKLQTLDLLKNSALCKKIIKSNK